MCTMFYYVAELIFMSNAKIPWEKTSQYTVWLAIKCQFYNKLPVLITDYCIPPYANVSVIKLRIHKVNFMIHLVQILKSNKNVKLAEHQY